MNTDNTNDAFLSTLYQIIVTVMKVIMQKVNLEPVIILSPEIEIKVNQKGKSKPSKILKSRSGFPQVTTIQIFYGTNYIPGKIEFKK